MSDETTRTPDEACVTCGGRHGWTDSPRPQCRGCGAYRREHDERVASVDAAERQIIQLQRHLSAERARADRAEETLRLTRDGADLLVGAEEARQALEEKLREACGGSEPSEGHDYADEVIGLLRVTRGQREAAERDAASLRERVEERVAAWEASVAGRGEPQTRGYLSGRADATLACAEQIRSLLSAPSSSPAATGSDAGWGPLGVCDLRSGAAPHARTMFCTNWRPASPSPGESDAIEWCATCGEPAGPACGPGHETGWQIPPAGYEREPAPSPAATDTEGADEGAGKETT